MSTVVLTDHTTAEALFVSTLQPSEHPDAATLTATAATVLALHGCAGCAALVAAEFGDHPDIAAARMRWALDAEARCAHTQPAGGAR